MSTYIRIKPTYISLFAGGGGSSAGYREAGFNCLGQVDNNHTAVDTLCANFPSPLHYYYDIEKISPRQLLRDLDLKPGELDLLDASTPCQGFSTSGHMDLNDDRNTLYRYVIEIAKVLKPKAIFIENVKGLSSKKMKQHLEAINDILCEIGYVVAARTINSITLGVPQGRIRTCILAIRKDLNVEPTFPIMDAERRTIADVLPHISCVTPGQYDNTAYTPDGACFTITKTDCMFVYDKGSRRPRKPTPEELKKLQGFPDDFILPPKRRDAHAIIGNSVVPPLTEAIGLHLFNILFKDTHLRKLSDKPGDRDEYLHAVTKIPREHEYYSRLADKAADRNRKRQNEADERRRKLNPKDKAKFERKEDRRWADQVNKAKEAIRTATELTKLRQKNKKIKNYVK